MNHSTKDIVVLPITKREMNYREMEKLKSRMIFVLGYNFETDKGDCPWKFQIGPHQWVGCLENDLDANCIAFHSIHPTLVLLDLELLTIISHWFIMTISQSYDDWMGSSAKIPIPT